MRAIASSTTKVFELYEGSAQSYSEMMDSEIDLPVYADVLGRLAERVADVDGFVVDTSCGSGHMLSMYRERYDAARSTIGFDLSPAMVSIARSRLGPGTDVVVGDMRHLTALESDSAAAVLTSLQCTTFAPKISGWHSVSGIACCALGGSSCSLPGRGAARSTTVTCRMSLR